MLNTLLAVPALLSATMPDGRPALRVCVVHDRMRIEALELLLGEVVRVGTQLLRDRT